MPNDGQKKRGSVRYDSLLLRIWRRSGSDAPDWSGRIEHIQEGTALRFSDPHALIAYLWAVIGSEGSPGLAGSLPAGDAGIAGGGEPHVATPPDDAANGEDA